MAALQEEETGSLNMLKALQKAGKSVFEPSRRLLDRGFGLDLNPLNYLGALTIQAEVTMAPYAPWTSDRSGPQHTRPRIGRFGNRLSSRRR